MKKIVLALTLFGSLALGSELKNLLNNNYNELFDLELQKSIAQKNYNSLSWISPIMLTFERDWDTRISGHTRPINRYSISINQPIFKSGGIYYGIKLAKANYYYQRANIIKNKNALIARAIELLYQIKQTKLTIEKLKLQVKNGNIEINSRSELYKAGISDSIELDKALAKKDEAEISLLDQKAKLAELIGEFKKISSKNPNNLKVPELTLVNKDKYVSSNVDLDIANTEVITKKYAYKVTRSKYLPTVSVGYSYNKLSRREFYPRKKYSTYSLRVTMPISVNMGNDLEMAKLDTMISKLKVKNTKIKVEEDYDSVVKKIAAINRRISLANREAKIYKRLLRSTRSLYKAGQKSINDVILLKNSLRMKRLDAKIFYYQKQLVLLKLYTNMR